VLAAFAGLSVDPPLGVELTWKSPLPKVLPDISLLPRVPLERALKKFESSFGGAPPTFDAAEAVPGAPIVPALPFAPAAPALRLIVKGLFASTPE
jgi:hypothetical protein